MRTRRQIWLAMIMLVFAGEPGSPVHVNAFVAPTSVGISVFTRF